jgi:hypothetical protein
VCLRRIRRLVAPNLAMHLVLRVLIFLGATLKHHLVAPLNKEGKGKWLARVRVLMLK